MSALAATYREKLPGFLEVFSRPRLGPFCQRYGFRHIAALDRDLGWDATRPADVRRLWELIYEEEPWCITMSPPCGKLSKLQNLTPEERRRDPEGHRREVKEALAFVDLCVEIARYQLSKGKHFVFEAPPGAKSFQRQSLKNLVESSGVYTGTATGCAFDLCDPVTGDFMTKAWRFVTSAFQLAKAVHQRCPGGHAHQRTEGSAAGIRRTTWTQVYPIRLVRCMLRAWSRQRALDMRAHACPVEVEDEDAAEAEEGPPPPAPDDLCPRRRLSLEGNLRRLHVDLGHAPVSTMLRHLRHANATPEALRLCSKFECEECRIKAHPAPARPAAPTCTSAKD